MVSRCAVLHRNEKITPSRHSWTDSDKAIFASCLSRDGLAVGYALHPPPGRQKPAPQP